MVPKIRFKSFSTPLVKYRVEDILERFISPVLVTKTQKYREIGIRSHGRGLFHKEDILGSELGSKRVFWIKKDALILNIVFAWEQAVALTSAEDEGFIASHRFPMYYPKENKCNIDYIRRYFLTKKGKGLLESASPGGAGRNKTLGQKKFNELILSIPGIKEQEKIADFLSSVDTRINLLNKQYDLLYQYKKGIMQKIFSQEVRFKDENGKDFPQWRLKKIREISSLIKDGTHGTHNNVTESDFLLLSAKNIQEGKVVVDSKDRKISEIEFRTIFKNYKLSPGDILLSVVGTIGRVAIYSEQYANYAFQRSVAFFRFPQEQPEFIYQLFNSTKFKKELIIRQVISAQPGIYLGDLADISLEIPVQKEQMKIANFLSALDDKIAAKKAELDKLKAWKQGLSQQMFV